MLETLELGVDRLILHESARDKEETSGLGGSVIGETALDTAVGELLGVSHSNRHVTLESRVVDSRGDNASVGESIETSLHFLESYLSLSLIASRLRV